MGRRSRAASVNTSSPLPFAAESAATPTAIPQVPELEHPAGEREYRPFPNKGGRNWRQERLEVPLLISALGLPRGARILEVGCGRGIALSALARRLAPAYLVGIDIDITLLAEANRTREIAPCPHLVSADIRRLPFAKAAFDVVIDFGTCFHIASSADALREVARVLAPGGMFVTETKLGQLLSHPIRARGRSLPWRAAPALSPLRRAVLWQSRRRCST